MDKKAREGPEANRKAVYEPPQVISFRKDELLPEVQAQNCHTTSPVCITVNCTPCYSGV